MGSALSLVWPSRDDLVLSDEDEITEPTGEPVHSSSLPPSPPPSPVPLPVSSLIPDRRYPARALPLNVQDGAADLITDLKRVQLSVEKRAGGLTVLSVRIPKKRGAGFRYERCWPLIEDSPTLIRSIRALMDADGLNAMRSGPEFCARYPAQWWALVYFCGQDANWVHEMMINELI